ncbi:ketopantoate reductase family protein [Marinobacter caseinilyticus]|uniref:ketopantoate reductase family protein n=1 Tax=Marinobacter caseinilyticus TaxID=2692195 RepID=UPI00140BDAE1|nr:2-dehydropantoate 2-reductase [Marinobacter caseinilyticus]
MECLILGAGALGRLWAALMPHGSVAFVAKPDQSGVTCDYRLVSSDGARRPQSIPWQHLPLPGPVTALLVTTKAPDTLAALSTALQWIPDSTPVVLFQNGMGIQQAVARAYPRRPVLAASTTEGANRPVADELVHAGHGTTWVGPLNVTGQHAHADVVALLSQSRLDVRAEDNIEQRLRHKLAVNAGINAFTALLDCTNGEILTNPFYQCHIDELCTELAAWMTAEGQSTASSELRSIIEDVARATAGNTSSMRRDVQLGRGTEIDFINGYVARRCEELNLPAPVNRMLTERVQSLANPSQ